MLLLIGLYNRWATLLLGTIILMAITGVQVPGAVNAGKWLPSGPERDLLILASTPVPYVPGPGRPAVT